MYVSRWTLIYGVSQFQAVVIVHKTDHQNIEMLHINLMVHCRNGALSHGQNESTLDLSTVCNLHNCNTIAKLIFFGCSIGQ
jgi:hypothetical protein